jgi:hypothetical protein
MTLVYKLYGFCIFMDTRVINYNLCFFFVLAVNYGHIRNVV